MKNANSEICEDNLVDSNSDENSKDYTNLNDLFDQPILNDEDNLNHSFSINSNFEALDQNENFSSFKNDDDMNDDSSTIINMNKIIAKSIIDFKLKFHLPITAISYLLNLMNETSKLKFNSKMVPTSYYLLEQNLEISDVLDPRIGFKCSNCNLNVLVKKNEEDCPECKCKLNWRDINNQNNFFSSTLNVNYLYYWKALI